MQRRVFLLAALGTAACGRRDTSALARAVRWLWAQQSDDGGWHSKTYGMLRSGQSLTPFVLDALLSVPHEMAGVEKAFDFLKRTIGTDAIDYPNYSTGLAVRVAARLKRSASPWTSSLR